MDKIIELTKELKGLIEDTELVKEFRRVEHLYKNNSELLSLSSQIEEADKSNDNVLKQSLVKEFNSHPLVINYMNLKQDVFDYLKEITNIINK